jgi:hypothetical protein
MTDSFLSAFMHLAKQKTGAERGLALNNELAIVDLVNLEQVDVMSAKFTGLETARQAMESGEAIITNNAVLDPARAPVTNTSFSNLKVVVVIPVPGYGAVYLDQPIKRGIFSKEIVDRLAWVAAQAIQLDQTGSSAGQLDALYQQLA